MIAIVDYGVGNLFSLRSSFKYIGQQAEVTSDAARIRESDRIVLPGVGAFGMPRKSCAERLAGVVTTRPQTASCFWHLPRMQLLFDKSFEYASTTVSGLSAAASYP
jgi:glutamine amidotransferase